MGKSDAPDRCRRSILGAAVATLPSLALSQLTPGSQGKDVVVVVPGITGSVLTARGKDVWNPSAHGLVRALLTLGSSLGDLRLEGDRADPRPLDDEVIATRLVDDVHIIPGLWKIDGYSKLYRSLAASPGIRAGENLFAFPYDWRRDNRASALQLQISAHQWLKTWRERSGIADSKLIILAHSMGGLVARHYIECLDGWRDTRKLITFGTPFRGSLNALRFLHAGPGALVDSIGLVDLGSLVRSFTSVYQLLPVYPCVLDGNVAKRPVELVGVRNLDSNMVRQAAEFHRDLDVAVVANRRSEGFLSAQYALRPVVGVDQTTTQVARLNGKELTFESDDPQGPSDGDGTVPRPSATPLELQGTEAELFVSEIHGSLQNSDSVITQVRSQLKDSQYDWKRYRSVGRNPSMSVPDVVIAGSDLDLSGALDLEKFSDEMEIEVTEAYSGRAIGKPTIMVDKSGTYRATMQIPSVGILRVRARFARRASPDLVTLADVVCVMAKR